MSDMVTSFDTSIEATARVYVAGTPDLKADYVQRRIQPFYVLIRYRYVPPEGHLQPVWMARSVNVTGYAILKPGRDGTQRIGTSTHKAEWSSWTGHDVRDQDARRPLPDWLREIVTARVPTLG